MLNEFDIKPMRALVLAISSRFDQREAAAALSFLVSLGVRLVIAATIRSGGVAKPLSDAAKKVYLSEVNTAKNLRVELDALVPGDASFRESFEIARVATARLARYYLRSLEMTAKGQQEPWFYPVNDPDIINLEHVLPEQPEGNWPQFTPDDVAQYSKRLGNLVLMKASDNSNLGSATFQEKRAIYSASPYELTLQVADAADWSPTAIRERQRILADLALRTWPIGSKPKSAKSRVRSGADVNVVR